MKKIKLFNRDGAKLFLEEIGGIDKENSEYKLTIDDTHSYCLKYVRYILNSDNKTIYAVDPAGGPFMAVGNTIEDKYQIVKINNITSIIICERNNKG